MSSDQSGGEGWSLEDLAEEIRVEKARAIYTLTRIADSEPKDIYKEKGKLYAFNTVLTLIDEQEQGLDLTDEQRERLLQLSEAEDELFEARTEPETNGQPPDINNEVY